MEADRILLRGRVRHKVLRTCSTASFLTDRTHTPGAAMCPVKEHFEKQLQEREAEVSSKIPRKAFLKELTELQNMPF